MSDPRTPDAIGPYRVLRRLGRGGMAEVYVAEDRATGEEHALKIMMRGTPHADRFNQEYEALTRLNHPSIVRVYQYGIWQNAPWFSMELIAGEPLQLWMKRVGRPGTPARSQEVMRAGAYVADAIAYIHERGLIHRDLKGNNVLMLPDGRVKLLDFGTAHIRDGMRQLTRPGEFIGTLAYASPEQFRGQAVDHRVDIYALGVLLYRMITGHRPFAADDPASLARLIARALPKPPSELVEDLPEGLQDLILELLAKRPDDRPPNARIVAERLEELIGEPLSLPGWGAAVRVDRMTGREDLLRQVQDRLRQGRRPVLLLGQAGSDRVRVADAVINDFRREGQLALTARLTPEQPIQDLMDMVLIACEGSTFDDPRVSEALRALRMIRTRGKDVLVRMNKGLIAAMVSVLVGLARTRGAVGVLIHDVHHADPPSLDLITRMVEVVAKGNLNVGFLLTTEHREAEALRGLHQRIPESVRINLPPLNVPQVALKVGAMLDRRPPPTAMARTIHQVSGGQPLWVEAVVNDLVEHGSIRLIGEDGNRIEWDITDDLEVPEEATEELLRAVLALPMLQRRTLQAIALAGSPAPLKLVASGLGWSSSQLLFTLKPLNRAGWVRVDEGVVSFSQPLLSRLVPALVPPERRFIFEQTLSEALDEAPPRGEHVELLLAAGHHEEAVERALDAADAYLDDLATVDALEVLDRLAPLATHSDGVNPELLARAFLLRANCLLMVRPVDPSLPRSLAAAKRHAQDPATKVRVLIARARLHRTVGHLLNHQKHLQEAWTAAEACGDARLSSIVATFLAEALRLQGRVRDAQDWTDQALAHAEVAGPLPLAWARAAQAALLVAKGQFGEAEPVVRTAIETFREHGSARGLWSALPTLVEILRLRGHYSEALSLLYTELFRARRCQEPIPTVRLLLAAAEVEADLHRLGRAQEHIDEIDNLVRKGEQLELRLAASVVRGRILLASGHHRPAQAALEEAHDRTRSAGLTGLSEFARALLAETLQAREDRRAAMDLFASAVLGLLGAGNAVALVEGTLARLRAQGANEPSDKIIKPIAQLLAREDLPVVHVERLLADARHHARFNRRSDARHAALEAQHVLETLNDHLDDTDRAALRLHPWSRAIRTTLK